MTAGNLTQQRPTLDTLRAEQSSLRDLLADAFNQNTKIQRLLLTAIDRLDEAGKAEKDTESVHLETRTTTLEGLAGLAEDLPAWQADQRALEREGWELFSTRTITNQYCEVTKRLWFNRASPVHGDAIRNVKVRTWTCKAPLMNSKPHWVLESTNYTNANPHSV